MFNDILTMVGLEATLEQLSKEDPHEAVFFKSKVILHLSQPILRLCNYRVCSHVLALYKVWLFCTETLFLHAIYALTLQCFAQFFPA